MSGCCARDKMEALGRLKFEAIQSIIDAANSSNSFQASALGLLYMLNKSSPTTSPSLAQASFSRQKQTRRRTSLAGELSGFPLVETPPVLEVGLTEIHGEASSAGEAQMRRKRKGAIVAFSPPSKDAVASKEIYEDRLEKTSSAFQELKRRVSILSQRFSGQIPHPRLPRRPSLKRSRSLSQETYAGSFSSSSSVSFNSALSSASASSSASFTVQGSAVHRCLCPGVSAALCGSHIRRAPSVCEFVPWDDSNVCCHLVPFSEPPEYWPCDEGAAAGNNNAFNTAFFPAKVYTLRVTSEHEPSERDGDLLSPGSRDLAGQLQTFRPLLPSVPAFRAGLGSARDRVLSGAPSDVGTTTTNEELPPVSAVRAATGCAPSSHIAAAVAVGKYDNLRLLTAELRTKLGTNAVREGGPTTVVGVASFYASINYVPLRLFRADQLKALTESLGSRGWPSEITERLTPLRLLEGLRVPRRTKSTLRLYGTGHLKAHPEKVDTGGEDAFFVSMEENCVGVADGVSEWKSYGVDPKIFSEELMQNCKLVTAQRPVFQNDGEGEGTSGNHAFAILQEGFARTKAVGGSTAVIAAVSAEGTALDVATLGDSCVGVLRRCKLTGSMRFVFRSAEQQHVFNMPYQLVRLPPPEDLPELERQGKLELVRATMRVYSGAAAGSLDSPDDACVYRVPLQEGDLLVLGTDGIFDNLFDEEIEELASFCVSPPEAEEVGCAELATPPGKFATLLVDVAFHRTLDERAKIPFVVRAEAAGCLSSVHAEGGKPDDMAAVVCWVVASHEAADQAEILSPRHA